ncbi:hypothetical protein MRX96_047146, partial [Rhipicephalus microplus]
VAKSEGKAGADALKSKELWVKNPSVTKNIITCYKEFMHVCNCNGHPTWYSAIQCEQDEVLAMVTPQHLSAHKKKASESAANTCARGC